MHFNFWKWFVLQSFHNYQIKTAIYVVAQQFVKVGFFFTPSFQHQCNSLFGTNQHLFGPGLP